MAELEHDLIRLDREFRRGTETLARAAAREAKDDGGFPLRRRLSEKATFDEVSPFAANDLVAKNMLPWIAEATLLRVNWDYLVEIAHAEEGHGDPTSPTRDDKIRRLLGSHGVDELRVQAAAMAENTTSISDAMLRYVDRHREATRLLEAPSSKAAHDRDARFVAAAKSFLKATESQVVSAASYWELLVASLGSNAGEGWPSKPSVAWLFETISPALRKGLSPRLPVAPKPLGALSFLRYLGALGGALAEIDLPSGIPFVMARHPSDLLPTRRSALFASVGLSASFHGRKLGLGRHRAIAQARRIAGSMLIAARVEAFRALVHHALFVTDGVSTRERFCDLSEEFLGVAAPKEMFSVLPRLVNGRALDRHVLPWHGILLSAADAEALRRDFDDDWFDNPRAVTTIRHEHHRAWELRESTADDVEAALGSLVRSFEDATS